MEFDLDLDDLVLLDDLVVVVPKDCFDPRPLIRPKSTGPGQFDPSASAISCEVRVAHFGHGSWKET